MRSSGAWPPSSGSPSASPPPLGNASPDALADAVRAGASRRLEAFLDGLDAYRAHRFARPATTAAVRWSGGGARLLDHGRDGERHTALLVPSLVNRHYVLDLLPERSLVAFLVEHGIRPLVLDWGDIVGEEFGFDLGDFVTRRLEPAFDAARALAGARQPTIVGYCMGGNLALALALRRMGDIAGLALLATPWDFHAERPDSARALGNYAAMLMPGFRTMGAMPLDVLQGFFAGLDPLLAYRKFRRFASLDPDSEEAIAFVALEDWLNDGVPLPWRVAEDCMVGWYGDNRTARGDWRVAGAAVRPGQFAKPSLAVIPHDDRIVPPASALALAEALPGCTTLRASAGHIGMMVGSRARRELWTPLAQWIEGLG